MSTSKDESRESRQHNASPSRKSTLLSAGSGSASSTRYQSTNLSSTASAASTIRRQSLFGTDDRVILDIGTRISKAGFSGESRPREIFWSCETPDVELWTADICRCRTEQDQKLMEMQLKARITTLFRSIFHQRLLVDPKQRKVVLVENALLPTIVKKTMYDVLFGNLQVPSVCFVPSPLLCTLVIGRMSSLVLDLGYNEASLLPIFQGRCLNSSHLLVSPRAGKRLNQRLRALLLHFGTFLPPSKSHALSSINTGSREALRIPAELLTDRFLEVIKAKTLIVGDCLTSNYEESDDFLVPYSSVGPSDWSRGVPFAQVDETADEVIMKVLESKYKQSTQVNDIIINIPPTPKEALVLPTQPSTLGLPSAPSSSSGRGSIIIPGWIRERAAEILFEHGDEDELSLVEMILQTLVKLPVDLRILLASNIYVVGGTAMLPGLVHRLRKEVVYRLMEARNADFVSSTLALSLPQVGLAKRATLKPRMYRNDTIQETEEGQVSDLRIEEPKGPSPLTLETVTMKIQRRRRELYQCRAIASLAPSIAFLNDHAPRIDVDGQPVGGVAPSFPLNLSSWIGGSLLGSLRIEMTDEKSGESWDQEQEDLREARSKAKKRDSDGRPGLGANKGSFLGTVGGLDTGSYGPLSAGNRGPFLSANTRSPPIK